MDITTLPETPTDADVDAWRSVLTDALAADQPHLPPPSRVEVAGRLRVDPARGRAVRWASPDGVAALLLFSDEGNEHTAFLDVLAVRPGARRRGIGSALWERVRETLLADGRTTVGAVIDTDGPGEAFARSLGFTNALPMAWYVQDVPAGPGAVTVPDTPGYTLVGWSGLVPDHLAPALAVAHDAMEDAPTGELEERTPAWTPERLRAVQQLVLDRGGELLTVAAVSADGEVAAYTELMLPDPAAERAVQYDTVVVPAHRGRGLGRAVKLRMLATVAGSHPGLRRIGTTVADENAPMRAVNAELGYVRERGAAYYQLTLEP
ncbi:GNAT family N-acetyltransferase [Streptomyces antimicrobicus]|uniref:GNAT family N-acetyltransferase n=1 Tax=Streptomyces antimicrobicus TaxID=2883108 RepID=A0ABS8B1K2_9ACTN|nr:GNAT family N-acetyltransferase [Streptomyces antimicrobicus]MCB5178481.1 GNAT family N-acetyltransferase [Streptomyces antimicrobicus]